MMNRTPLAAKADGTSVEGARRRAARVLSATRSRENTDVAMSIVGSVVYSRDVRKSASRVAFPLTICAVTAAAPVVASAIKRDSSCVRLDIRPYPLAYPSLLNAPKPGEPRTLRWRGVARGADAKPR